jgi:hypothetical protein
LGVKSYFYSLPSIINSSMIIPPSIIINNVHHRTRLPQWEMIFFPQGLTGVFRQAGETSDAHSIHTCR